VDQHDHHQPYHEEYTFYPLRLDQLGHYHHYRHRHLATLTLDQKDDANGTISTPTTAPTERATDNDDDDTGASMYERPVRTYTVGSHVERVRTYWILCIYVCYRLLSVTFPH
jgi:hypothetical protein